MMSCNKQGSMKNKVFLVFLSLHFLWAYWPDTMKLFSKMFLPLHNFDCSQCNLFVFLAIIINQMWGFANVTRNTIISFRGDIQKSEQPAIHCPYPIVTDTGANDWSLPLEYQPWSYFQWPDTCLGECRRTCNEIWNMNFTQTWN